jgi:hypothetical protein
MFTRTLRSSKGFFVGREYAKELVMNGKCLILGGFLILLMSSAYAKDSFVLTAQEPLLLPQTMSNPFHGGVSAVADIKQEPLSLGTVRLSGDSLLRWMRFNISAETGMFKSFYISPDDKSSVYAGMGGANSVGGIIERTIVENGLDIYDGAVAQIALTLSGVKSDMALAQKPVAVYWKGALGHLFNIRAGYPMNNFVYDPAHPEMVASDERAYGQRGFVFRIINANGDYLSPDPIDGKTSLEGFPTWPDIHWEDWKPVAGENAWVVIAAMRLFHVQWFDEKAGRYLPYGDSLELKLSEEIARAAIKLQSDTGGIRMAPLGTFRENEPDSTAGKGQWWYNQISTENNLSWYAAFRMLYQVTGKDIYRQAMRGIERYLRRVYSTDEGIFYQGMSFVDGTWRVNRSDFAVDVQTWGILSLGVKCLDEWFGDGASYGAWLKVKENSSSRDKAGQLLGVGYTHEHDRVSVEWTAGAIMAVKEAAEYYRREHSDWSDQLDRDAHSMRAGVELLRQDLAGGMSAYAYSSKRGWIPFGWNSHDPRVMSLASTGWIFLVDREFNPFFIDGRG